MVRRRSHNEYAKVYDPSLMSRTPAYEGVPCADCGFPVIRLALRDDSGHLRHIDCSEPAPIEDIECLIAYHEGANTGFDIDEVQIQMGGELRRRAQKLRDDWADAARKRPGPGAAASNRPGRRTKPGQGATSSPDGSAEEVRRVAAELLERLGDGKAEDTELRMLTSRQAADRLARALKGHIVSTQLPRRSEPGVWVFAIQAQQIAAVRIILHFFAHT